MIAAHARAMGAVVVTNNVDDFERVKGLIVENWTKWATWASMQNVSAVVL